MTWRKLRTLGIGIPLAIFLLVPALGQNITSGMRGTVSDQTGAVIAGAKVTAKEVNTGYARDVVTDGSGGYVFTLLPVGTYDLSVEMPGFKKYTRTGIILTVNQVAGVNLTLELGEVTQTVEVVGGGVEVNTQTSEVGTLIGAAAIKELPLNGRNPIQLAVLSAGVDTSSQTWMKKGQVTTYLGEGGGTITDQIDGGGTVL